MIQLIYENKIVQQKKAFRQMFVNQVIYIAKIHYFFFINIIMVFTYIAKSFGKMQRRCSVSTIKSRNWLFIVKTKPDQGFFWKCRDFKATNKKGQDNSLLLLTRNWLSLLEKMQRCFAAIKKSILSSIHDNKKQ